MSADAKHSHLKQIALRFRQYLPVVIDVETGGFDCDKDALLEIAAVTISINEHGTLIPVPLYHAHIEPFANANLDPKALAFNKIDPFHPFREAIYEKIALSTLFRAVAKQVKLHGCNRAILVGHNIAFDYRFLDAAIQRNQIKRSPFHPFSTIDTVGLSAVMLGHTVLAEACKRAGLDFDNKHAHHADYDAKLTAELFCYLANQYTPEPLSKKHGKPSDKDDQSPDF